MAKRPGAALARSSTRVRCAIYTRKSAEEGLDQAFNSLDAQREACAAYISSQRAEGWTMLPAHYDDGGFSGGTMERPALKRLLAEVAAGKVDVIVIYKVDRLTRAFPDFAKIVEVLDGAGASFVSVTQSFNTTTSMGRLTLNMLLSFAQFEREVTGERIRDKVAASKKKGMWMGGTVPLGYDVQERKLVVNQAEADRVRHIFIRYLALESIGELAAELDDQAIRSKRRELSDGRISGDRPFSPGALAHLLKNHIYVGEVSNLGQHYPGEHQPIVAQTLFDRVQARIAANTQGDRSGGRAASISLLAGILTDGEGRRMTPRHATKSAPSSAGASSRRYRYYVTAPVTADRRLAASAWKVPAGELEQLVRERMALWLRDPQSVLEICGRSGGTSALPALITAAAQLAGKTAEMAAPPLRRLMIELGVEVQVKHDQVLIGITAAALIEKLGGAPSTEADHQRHCIIAVPAALTRRGQELRLAFAPDDRSAPAQADTKLVGLVAKAYAAHRRLLTDGAIEKIAKGHLTRLARLATLAPDIISAIIDGRQPVQLTARTLLRVPDLPLAWDAQRKALGFGQAPALGQQRASDGALDRSGA